MRFHFGKHRGKTVEIVLEEDIHYLFWILSKFTARSKLDNKLVDYVCELLDGNRDWKIFDNAIKLQWLADCNMGANYRG